MLSYDFNKSIEYTWQQRERLVSTYLFNYKKHLFFKVFIYLFIYFYEYIDFH